MDNLPSDNTQDLKPPISSPTSDPAPENLSGPGTGPLYQGDANQQQPPTGEYSSSIYSSEFTPESNISLNPPQSYSPSAGEVPPMDSTPTNVPPPPFEEGNKSKILLLGGGILFALIIIFFLFKFLTRAPGTPKSATLTYWGLWEDSTIMQPLIDEFQKSHPNIKISYTKQSPKQYRERLQAALGRGEGPDIFRFHNTWTDMMLNNLSPMPSTLYSPSDFDKTFYPVAKSDLNRGTGYFGIPLEIDGLVVLYNDDMVKAGGITIPTSWEDFRNTALKLTVKDTGGNIQTAGVALGSADNIEHFSDILALMMLQNGTNLKDVLGPCADASTSTCAVDSLIFYRKFADLPNNTWDDTLDNSISAFAGGKVAMIFAPTWEIFTVKQINPNLNFKIAQIPQLPGLTINWATYWVEGVSRSSKNQAAAWEFLKFLSSKESLTKLYTEEAKTRLFGEPYSRVDLAPALSSDPYLGPLLSEAPTMKSFPLASDTQDNGIDDQMIKYLLDAVNSLKQGGNPQSALETASQGFKQVLTKYGIIAAPPTAAQ